ncbi:MAG TPA: M67 family metallopeptidase [Kiritimatiellia bacterium]|nr:M67 family metallopeptidase [Kiritimatiellia bacterium]
MIVLTHEQQDRIRAHGEADFPHECCGLMLGRFEPDGIKTVEEILPISNAREEAAKRNRFLITAEEMMRGEKIAREKKLDVIGFYHSHPDCPAVPSRYDLEHAWPAYSYVIVSVNQGRADMVLSWELNPDRTHFDSESIKEPSGETK